MALSSSSYFDSHLLTIFVSAANRSVARDSCAETMPQFGMKPTILLNVVNNPFNASGATLISPCIYPSIFAYILLMQSAKSINVDIPDNIF